MQSKASNSGFDVCLFDKQLNLHITSTQKSSPVIKEAKKSPRSVVMSMLSSPRLRIIGDLFPLLVFVATLSILVKDLHGVLCTIYFILVLMLSCLAPYVKIMRVQYEIVVLVCAGVVCASHCSESERLSTILIVSVFAVCLVEISISKLYLSKVLLIVQTGSVCSLLIFRVAGFFESETYWMELVVTMTTPVVLVCVWVSNNAFGLNSDCT